MTISRALDWISVVAMALVLWPVALGAGLAMGRFLLSSTERKR